jgi:uncharacterized protein (DUF427 family)
MKAVYGAQVFGEFHSTLLCDGHVYVPRDCVDMSVLSESTRVYHCPNKGMATYYNLVTPERVVPNIAWSYLHPYPDHADIAGMIAFSKDVILKE